MWIELTDVATHIYDMNLRTATRIQLRQLCCHPTISDTIKTCGNEEDLVQVQYKLITYYKTRIDDYTLKPTNQ